VFALFIFNDAFQLHEVIIACFEELSQTLNGGAEKNRGTPFPPVYPMVPTRFELYNRLLNRQEATKFPGELDQAYILL
jgi:hypothetical protein